MPGHADFKVGERRRVHDGFLKVEDVDFEFTRYDGTSSGKQTHQVCVHGDAAAVLSYDRLVREPVARLLAEETGRDRFALRTGRGVLATESAGNGRFRVNMGPPVLDWAGIPLAEDIPRDPLPIEGEPAAVGMGNPHCVFVVTDMEAIDLAGRGAEIERHPLFPERTNVEFVEVPGVDHLPVLRIPERVLELIDATVKRAAG